MPRPSPRTGTTGAGIQKFGTQQLKYIDPTQPALGVIEKDVGARTRLYYGGEATTPKTPFSATYQAQRPATIRTTAQLETSPHAIPESSDWRFPQAFADEGKNGECVEADPFCGFREFMEGKPAGTYCKCPNWFGWGNGNGNGKEKGCTECESCPPEKQAIGTCDCGIHCGVTPPTPPKPCPECPPNTISLGSGTVLDPCRCVKDDPCTTECTTCNSDKCAECDAWDVPCETCRKKNGTCTPPVSPCGCLPYDFGCELKCWWDKYGIYVMIVAGLIGLGVLLWLLRPLFGIAKNVTGMMKK